MSFAIKPTIFRICSEIANEFPDWSFSAGKFKNKTLRHTDLVVSPFSDFKGGKCSVNPAAAIVNKNTIALGNNILGRDPIYTSVILHKRQLEEYRGEKAVRTIWPEKFAFIDAQGVCRSPQDWPVSFIVLNEAPGYLRKVLQDGIGFLKQYYDFTSEEHLLRHLPASEKVWAVGGMEEGAGVMQCLAHIVVGDFRFVEYYCSDDFKTVYPKKTPDLDKIIATLPELKKRYAETGKVI